jgi:hypothetical protein
MSSAIAAIVVTCHSDRLADLRPDEPERLQDREVAAPSAGGAGERVGQRTYGYQGQQPRECGRQARDADQADHAGGPLGGGDVWVRQALDVVGA